MQKVLLIHCYYTQLGGEDVMFEQESRLLESQFEVKRLTFRNRSGLLGIIQFAFQVWNVFASRKVRKAIKEFKPDLVHIHNLHFAIGPLVIRGIKRAGLPVVVTLHNYRMICPSGTLFANGAVFTHGIEQKFKWAAIENKVFRDSYLLTFWLSANMWFHEKIGTWKMVDKFICLNDFHKELMLRSPLFQERAEDILIKPNFADPTEIQRTDTRNYFLYVGRLSYEKGLDTLLKAFEHSDIPLRIVGAGPMEEEVLRICNRSSNITYLGACSREDTYRQMKGATALVFPSLTYETFGLVIIEAFSLGTPVIASDQGFTSKLIKPGIHGLHFETGNSEALKRAVIEWQCLDEELKERMSMHTERDYKSLYNSKCNLITLNEIYRLVMGYDFERKETLCPEQVKVKPSQYFRRVN